MGDRFHFTVYTASLVVTYFILGFWVCYIVFCLLRGLISCSRTLAKGGNPCEGCVTFWRSMVRPAPVLPFTRLQGAELQVRPRCSLRFFIHTSERPRRHPWFRMHVQASDAAPEPAAAKPQYEEKDDDFLSLPTPGRTEIDAKGARDDTCQIFSHVCSSVEIRHSRVDLMRLVSSLYGAVYWHLKTSSASWR